MSLDESTQPGHAPSGVAIAHPGYVVIPLDYFLRLVDVAARQKYEPKALPVPSSVNQAAPAEAVAGSMRQPSPPMIPMFGTPHAGPQWSPRGAATDKPPEPTRP